MKLITKEHVISICKELGSDYKKDSKGNLIFNTCICHEGGKSQKLYYYHDPNPNMEDDKGKRFKCYTCDDHYDLIQLVIRAHSLQGKSITYFQALNYIAAAIGYSQADINSIESQVVENDMSWMNRLLAQKRATRIKHPKPLNEHILEIFSYVEISDWKIEGINQNTIEKYQISYWDRDNGIIIPHRYYSDGSLVGIKERLLDKDKIDQFGKYVPITVQGVNLSYQTSLNLYGLYYNRHEIEQVGKIIIFEAEKSVLKIDTFYGDHSYAVATCGSTLSKTQVAIIKRLHIQEVMLAYDKEYEDAHSFEAEAYKNKLILMLEPLVNYFTCYLVLDGEENLLEMKQSPADKDAETLCKLMKQKLEVTMEMVLEVKNDKRYKHS